MVPFLDTIDEVDEYLHNAQTQRLRAESKLSQEAVALDLKLQRLKEVGSIIVANLVDRGVPKDVRVTSLTVVNRLFRRSQYGHILVGEGWELEETVRSGASDAGRGERSEHTYISGLALSDSGSVASFQSGNGRLDYFIELTARDLPVYGTKVEDGLAWLVLEHNLDRSQFAGL